MVGQSLAFTGKTRQSNIEFLRLLSMMMVLNLHSFWGYDHGSGLVQIADFYRETLCICAVDVFILISGYFGIKWKFQSLFNLLFQVAFYSFAIYGYCVASGIVAFNMHDFLGLFKCYNSSWGFITSYLILYFLSPALNVISDQFSSTKLLVFIVVLLFLNISLFALNDNITFYIVYLVGRLLRKTNTTQKLSLKNCGFFYFVTTTIIFLIVYPLYKIFNLGASQMQSLFIGYSYCSPLVILQAVTLFLFFFHFRFQNKIINWCSSSCLSIFLIHMHPTIKEIGYYDFTQSLYYKPLCEHIIILVLLVICVFVGSILVDKVRIYISDKFYKILFKIWSTLPNKITSFDTYIPKQIKNIL